MKTDKVRCILVDDEIEGLDILEFLLSQIEGVEVLVKIDNPQMVISELLEHEPDIAFIDINMPNKSGLDLLKEINNLRLDISVIFVTAFDQYIFDALKNSAFDYLVKPVDREELNDTIQRFKENREDIPALSEIINSMEGVSKIKIPINYGSLFFDPDEMVYFEADGNYTTIYLLDGNTELTSLNIGKLEEKLKGRTFFRTSRSIIINLKFLYKLDKRDKKCIIRYGERECTLSVSRQYIRVLDSCFEKH
ncbi:MAG: LytTR family DNA-binding domain-containing protein [Marinifilaceae bacterium]